MRYKVLLNDDETKVLWDSDVLDESYFLKPSYKHDLNSVPSFDFVILPPHPLYDEIIQLKSIVSVYRINGNDNRQLFYGRVLQAASDFYGQKAVTCEGVLSFLTDSIIPKVKNKKETPLQSLQRIISVHNQEMTTDPTKQFTVGTVNVSDINTEKKFSSEGWNTARSAIDSLVNKYKGYIFGRHENGVNYIDWLEMPGRNNNQHIRLDRNAIDLKSEENADALYTVLMPVDSKNHRLNASSGGVALYQGGDAVFLKDDESIAKYGIIVKSETFNDADNRTELYELASKKFAQRVATMPIKVTIKAVDMYALDSTELEIRLGDKMTQIEGYEDTDDPLYVTSISLDLLEPQNDDYTLETKSSFEKTSTGGNGSLSSGGGAEPFPENTKDVVRSYDNFSLQVRENLYLSATKIEAYLGGMGVVSDRNTGITNLFGTSEEDLDYWYDVSQENVENHTKLHEKYKALYEYNIQMEPTSIVHQVTEYIGAKSSGGKLLRVYSDGAGNALYFKAQRGQDGDWYYVTDESGNYILADQTDIDAGTCLTLPLTPEDEKRHGVDYVYISSDGTPVQSLSSKIEQNANYIGLVVKNGEIAAAEISVAINRSTGLTKAKISADNIYLDGSVESPVISLSSIFALNQGSGLDIYSPLHIRNNAGSTAGTVSITGGWVLANGFQVNSNGSITFPSGSEDYNPLSLNRSTLAGMIQSVSLNTSTNTLTLTPFVGNPINFSKATTLHPSWSSGTFTVIAKQSNVEVNRESISPVLDFEGNGSSNFSAVLREYSGASGNVLNKTCYLVASGSGTTKVITACKNSDGTGVVGQIAAPEGRDPTSSDITLIGALSDRNPRSTKPSKTLTKTDTAISGQVWVLFADDLWHFVRTFSLEIQHTRPIITESGGLLQASVEINGVTVTGNKYPGTLT